MNEFWKSVWGLAIVRAAAMKNRDAATDVLSRNHWVGVIQNTTDQLADKMRSL